MGCGPSNSANAAVEPFLDNAPGAETNHRPANRNSGTNTPNAQQQKLHSGTTKTIRTNKNTKDIHNNYDHEERIQYSNGAGPFSAPNGTQHTAQNANLPSAKSISPVEGVIQDRHWQELWLAHKDILLDPADVHATLQDLMANATNRLSDAEILFLQRRVRSIVRQSHLQAEQQSMSNGGKNRKKTRRSSGGSPLGNSTSGFMQELQDTHSIAKNHHLLTAHVLRKVLPEPPVPMVKCNIEFLASNFTQTKGSQSDFGNFVDLSSIDNNVGSDTISSIKANDSVSTIRTVETTYLLALFCNDVLWDNVANIAVDSAKANDLEMDVNKIVNESKDNTNKLRNNHSNASQVPAPSEPSCERSHEMPLGMGLHALTFILGLGLRK
jgi:hypothetical protein